MSFETAVEFVRRTDTGFTPAKDDQLRMYGLYKQATQGDVTGDAPSAIYFKEAAKYAAWQKCAGMTQEDARKKYVEELSHMCNNWESKC